MFLSKHKNSLFYVYYEDVDGKRNKVSKKAKLKSGANEFLSKFQEELKLRAERKLVPIALSEFKIEILRHSESVHSPKATSNYLWGQRTKSGICPELVRDDYPHT